MWMWTWTILLLVILADLRHRCLPRASREGAGVTKIIKNTGIIIGCLIGLAIIMILGRLGAETLMVLVPMALPKIAFGLGWIWGAGGPVGFGAFAIAVVVLPWCPTGAMQENAAGSERAMGFAEQPRFQSPKRTTDQKLAGGTGSTAPTSTRYSTARATPPTTNRPGGRCMCGIGKARSSDLPVRVAV